LTLILLIIKESINNDYQRRVNMRFWGKFMIGAILGGLFGAVVGLLIAPDSGQELRGKVTNSILQIRDEVAQASADKRQELQEQLNRLRQPISLE
jgi:gas vesicle protein